jgi:hypothetical protein
MTAETKVLFPLWGGEGEGGGVLQRIQGFLAGLAHHNE